MEALVSDHTTFKQIFEDPIIAEEDRLIRSQPARLYGLPKVHKTGLPLRPILSASGTFNYGIAQLLVHRLSHLKKHSTVIDDTFKFVDELHSLNIDMTQH
ncbi:unnamed protein product, partial [Rotaria sp. Silwood1]